MKLTIAIPGLFWQDIGDLDYLYSKLELPNFSYILKHAKVSSLNYNYSDLVYSISNKEITGRIAESLAAKAGILDKHKNFLLAEPTHLRLDRDRLQISESELLQMDTEEAEQIIDIINKHFEGEIKLYFLNENLWLLGHNIDVQSIKFHPILDIIGENVDDFLPKGVGAIQLNKLINEIQMLLYGLSENKERQQEGSLTINSLWLWDKTLAQDKSYSSIYANNLTSLISRAKIHPISQPITQNFVANSLVIIDRLYHPCCYRDSFGWIDQLQQLDQTLGQPLRNLLEKGKISELNILVPQQENTIQLTIRPSYKYKFWQNKQLINIVKESHAL